MRHCANRGSQTGSGMDSRRWRGKGQRLGGDSHGARDRWVMQCPASLARDAPIRGRDDLRIVPDLPARVERIEPLCRNPLTRMWSRPPSRVRHAQRIEMGPWRSTALPEAPIRGRDDLRVVPDIPARVEWIEPLCRDPLTRMWSRLPSRVDRCAGDRDGAVTEHSPTGSAHAAS